MKACTYLALVFALTSASVTHAQPARPYYPHPVIGAKSQELVEDTALTQQTGAWGWFSRTGSWNNPTSVMGGVFLLDGRHGEHNHMSQAVALDFGVGLYGIVDVQAVDAFRDSGRLLLMIEYQIDSDEDGCDYDELIVGIGGSLPGEMGLYWHNERLDFPQLCKANNSAHLQQVYYDISDFRFGDQVQINLDAMSDATYSSRLWISKVSLVGSIPLMSALPWL